MSNPLERMIPTFVVGFLAGVLGAALVVQSAMPGGIGFFSALRQNNPPRGDNLNRADNTIVPGSQESLVVAAAEKAAPAVVSVVITQDVPIVERYYNDPFDSFGNGLFGPFQFQIPQFRQRGTEKQEVGGGSGFFISQDGYIVTNKHVVSEENAEYTVFTSKGDKYEAKVVARDPVNDIAILRIDAQDMPFLTFANSDQLKVGQAAIAIGNALGEFSNSVSVGVVSGLARSIVAGDAGTGQTEQLDRVIQTDAAINPGNSGGPLLNLAGQVIGVNVAQARGSENIAFALPANAVSTVAESVKQTGKIVRPYLGVRYMPVTEPVKDANNLPYDYGALVSRGESMEQLAVIPNSPADKAGLAEGDIILEADGKKITEELPLSSIIRDKRVGENVTLKVWHKGGEKTVTVRLEEMPQ